MKHIYSSVDIGSDTIKIAVCELYKGKLNLLASSSVKSNGIKKGLITDFEACDHISFFLGNMVHTINQVNETAPNRNYKNQNNPSYFKGWIFVLVYNMY